MNRGLHFTCFAFLCLLLLLPGIAGADEDLADVVIGVPIEIGDPPIPGPLPRNPDPSDPLNQTYSSPAMVYISDSWVSIELNPGVSPGSPEYFLVRDYTIYAPGDSVPFPFYSGYNDPSSQLDLSFLQFQATLSGSYTVLLRGSQNLEPGNSNKIYEREFFMTFDVVDVDTSSASNPSNPIITAVIPSSFVSALRMTDYSQGQGVTSGTVLSSSDYSLHYLGLS